MDPQPVPFTYELVGCVNGALAALRIEGVVARDEVWFAIKVTSPTEPLLWDEQILVLASIDPVVLLSLDPGPLRHDAAPEIFRVESGLFDEGEKAAGRLVVYGCWGVEDGRIAIRAQIIEGWMNLEPMERVTRVGESSPMSVLAANVGRIVGTRTWTVETSRGNSYSAVSVSRTGAPAGHQQGRGGVLRLRWTTVADSAVGEGPTRQTYRVVVARGD